MYRYCYLFILFMLYAIIGFVIEVINSLIHQKKFVNRGFLIGPYIPIYAIGVMLILYLLKDYTGNILVLFILSSVICMTLEYLTSYIMEKLFNARWWNYSNRKYNLNGRVCLETTIPFGLGGTLAVYFVNPFFIRILNGFSEKLITILGVSLAVIFFTDLIISLIVASKFRNINLNKFKDNTEEMNKKVREYLLEHSILTRRIIRAFPGYKMLEKIKEYKR